MLLKTLYKTLNVFMTLALLAGSLVSPGLDVSAASSIKLNDPLVVNGEVIDYSYQISANSNWVVYLADQETDDVIELYSVAINGNAKPIKLNGGLTSTGDVVSFSISPDSNQVVYKAAQDTNEIYELYSVPINGGENVKLNGNMDWSKYIQTYTISADSKWVVYGTNQINDEAYEVYSVPIDRSAEPIKLNDSLASGKSIGGYRISPDNTRVVYMISDFSKSEIYSVPIDRHIEPIKLNGTLVSGGSVMGYQINASGGRVIYRADQDTNDTFRLYSVPIDRSTEPIELVDAGNVMDEENYRISMDGNWVVYMLFQNETVELYSIPVDKSSQPIKLNGDLIPDGTVWSYEISADSRRVVYRADQDTNDVFELYSVPIDRSEDPIKLNETLTSGMVWYFYYISANGNWVIYSVDADLNNLYELYSVKTNGTERHQLTDNLIPTNSIPRWDLSLLSMDNYWAIYRDETCELYSVPTDKSVDPVVLNGELVPNGCVGRFEISADSNWVVYVADQDTDKVDELYSVALNSDHPEVNVLGNDTPIANGDTTPDLNDGTDFGSIILDSSGVTHTFVITNTGTASLNLASTPPITLTNGTIFNITTQPAMNVIAPSTAVTFTITFAPPAAGIFTDTVTIANNDTDENPYTFTIAGTGKDESKYIIFLPLITNSPSEP